MVQKNNDFRPDTYCGLYCGACEIMSRYQASLATKTPVKREDLPKQFRENIYQEGELICRGCKTDVLFEGCRRCLIRICAKEKGVEACIECVEYPCEGVGKLLQITGEATNTLPHTRVMFRNMDIVKEKGIEYWAKNQAKRWSCPQCGTSFTWYQKICAQCGRELESLKDYNNY